jgi:hypothetical protein
LQAFEKENRTEEKRKKGVKKKEKTKTKTGLFRKKLGWGRL